MVEQVHSMVKICYFHTTLWASGLFFIVEKIVFLVNTNLNSECLRKEKYKIIRAIDMCSVVRNTCLPTAALTQRLWICVKTSRQKKRSIISLPDCKSACVSLSVVLHAHVCSPVKYKKTKLNKQASESHEDQKLWSNIACGIPCNAILYQ